MITINTDLPGVFILEPEVHRDERGWLAEVYQRARLEHSGVDAEFVQDNISFSARGTLRGIHFQTPNSQGRMVLAPQGEIFDVAVDLRRGSPRFGRWIGVTLSEENMLELWIPPGFGHGFLVTGKSALVMYKCTSFYAPQAQRAVRFDDPRIGVDWPERPSLISEKDRNAPLLDEIDPMLLPVFDEGVK